LCFAQGFFIGVSDVREKNGRKSALPEIIAKLDYITEYAAEMLSGAQIAKKLGLSTSTWYKHYKNPKIQAALKKGEKIAVEEVENALFKSAIGYEYSEVKVIKQDNSTVRQEVTKKHVQGNVTAQIFILQNKVPDKYKDRRNVELTGKDGGPVALKTETTHIYLPEKGSFTQCQK
jgi:hypothetical protein